MINELGKSNERLSFNMHNNLIPCKLLTKLISVHLTFT